MGLLACSGDARTAAIWWCGRLKLNVPCQVIRPALLQRGFQLVRAENLAVTDDVSIIEALGLPVQVTPGSYTNIKVSMAYTSSVPANHVSSEAAAVTHEWV